MLFILKRLLLEKSFNLTEFLASHKFKNLKKFEMYGLMAIIRNFKKLFTNITIART